MGTSRIVIHYHCHSLSSTTNHSIHFIISHASTFIGHLFHVHATTAPSKEKKRKETVLNLFPPIIILMANKASLTWSKGRREDDKTKAKTIDNVLLLFLWRKNAPHCPTIPLARVTRHGRNCQLSSSVENFLISLSRLFFPCRAIIKGYGSYHYGLPLSIELVLFHQVMENLLTFTIKTFTFILPPRTSRK